MDIITGYILGGICVSGVGIIVYSVRKSNQRHAEEMKRIEESEKRRKKRLEEKEAARKADEARVEESIRTANIGRADLAQIHAEMHNRSKISNAHIQNESRANVRQEIIKRDLRLVPTTRPDILHDTGKPIPERRMRTAKIPYERRRSSTAQTTSATNNTSNTNNSSSDDSIFIVPMIFNNGHTESATPRFEGKGGTMDGGGASGNWEDAPTAKTFYSEPAAQTYTAPETTQADTSSSSSSSNTDSGSSSSSSSGSDGGGGGGGGGGD